MTLVPLSSNSKIIMSTAFSLAGSGTSTVALSSSSNYVATVGRVRLSDKSGSKTLSAAGSGKIVWRTISASTFSNAGTTLRIGIQDVNSSGNNDGTFDVYADLVGGTDTISFPNIYATTMENGSKVLNDGDLIALTFEMVTRGGSDSVELMIQPVRPVVGSTGYLFPYRISNGTKMTSIIVVGNIIFDDGTIGTIENIPLTGVIATQSFNQSSTPDEYASIFQIPFKATLSGCVLYLSSIGTSDNFEVVLYSDPEGSPSVIQSVAIDPVYVGSTTATGQFIVSFSEYDLDKNTWYGISVRPTTNNAINIGYMDFLSGNQLLKKISDFGEDIKFSARTNQTGAFSEVQTYYMPLFGILLSKLDDGTGSGNVSTINGVPVSGLRFNYYLFIYLFIYFII